MSISRQNFEFLNQLAANNNREWFSQHKDDYEDFRSEIKALSTDVTQLMSAHDHLEEGRTKIYRIYRDVRFSKDKTPYKTHWSGSFTRATPMLRGGYYFSIAPGRSFVAGGFFGPNAEDILHIRRQISQDPDPLFEMISSKDFQSSFSGIRGEQLKTAPRGFEKDDPAIALLRYKQFILRKEFADVEVLSADFAKQMNNAFKLMRPFLNYMSDILTTDLNGQPLL